MATTISLDSDDVLALLAYSALVRKIEDGVHASEEDPQVPQRTRMTEIHSRVQREYTRQLRPPPVPVGEISLSEFERQLVRTIFAHIGHGACRMLGPSIEQMRAFDNLEGLQLLQRGAVKRALFWAGEDRPSFEPAGPETAVKLTARGEAYARLVMGLVEGEDDEAFRRRAIDKVRDLLRVQGVVTAASPSEAE